MNDKLSRREFGRAAAGIGFVALAGGQKDPSVNATLLPIIDTHQHLWDFKRLRLPWLGDPKARHLQKSFLVEDYDRAAKNANVVKTVYMEVNCDAAQHEVEADYVLQIARSPLGRLRGAVIGGSMPSPKFGDYIKKFAINPFVKGVRMVLHDADRPPGMCLQPQFVDNVRLLGELGLSFDLCMRPGEILDGVRLVDKCPRTRFIIDHCGNRDVQSADAAKIGAWEKGMKEAAARPNVMCKISGIVVTARPGSWQPSDLAPTVNFCLDAFGQERVFFGGDWPVCTLTSSLQQWVDALKEIVKNRSPEFHRKLFHDNAQNFYKLT